MKMEIKKQMLRVMSIALMLSAFSPIYAVESKQARWALYKKCIAKRCNAAEKAQVRADVKKAGALVGGLLLAAAVAIGVRILMRKDKVTVDAALKKLMQDRSSVYVGLTPAQKNFISGVIKVYDQNGRITEEDLKVLRGIAPGVPTPEWLQLMLLIEFVAMLYYKTLESTIAQQHKLNDEYRLGYGQARFDPREAFGLAP